MPQRKRNIKDIKKANISQFVNFRNTFFTKDDISKLKTAKGLADQELSVANLNSLTPIVDGKDMAQVNSETYINNNIIYYMDSTLRTTVLGKQSAPVLTGKLLEIATKDGAAKFYTDISTIWLAYGIAQSNADFKVNTKILDGDLTVFFQKKEFIDQSNWLYQYAFIEQVPHIDDYIKDRPDYWAEQYYNFLMGDFLATYPSLVKANGQAVVNLLLRPILAKLDLLDPSSRTSTDLQFKLQYALFQDQLYANVSTTTSQPVFENTLLKNINEIIDSGENNATVAQIRKMSEIAGSASNLAAQLTSAFNTLATVDLTGDVQYIGAQAIQNGLARLSPGLRAFITNQDNIAAAKETLGALFLVASAVSLGYAYSNWDVLNTATKTKVVFSSVQLLASILALPAASKFFTAMAKIGADWFFGFLQANNVSQVAIDNTKYVMTAIFRDKFDGFIGSRVMPLFILANIGFLIYDCVQDSNNENWGALSLDIIATILTTLQLITALAAVVPWSGPVGTVLSVLTAVVLLIKMFAFPGKTPIEKFHDSLPKRYTDTSIQIGTPVGLTARSNIKDADTNNNFIHPDKDSPTKLSCGNCFPNLDQIKLSFVYNSGYLTIENPLNTLPGNTPASFLSCRASGLFTNTDGDLNLFNYNAGPAIETEAWVMVDTGRQNTFYLMAWNSKFLHVKSNGNLELSDSKKSAFLFSTETDWFLPHSNNSLMLDYRINMNEYVANNNWAMVLVSNGAYLVDISGKVDEFKNNVSDFVKNHDDRVKSTIVSIPGDKKPLPNDAYFKINENGDPMVKVDDNNKWGPSIAKTTKNVPFSNQFALVIPDDQNAGFHEMVVDSNYQTYRSNNFN
ncbi:hypothetical protein DLAC_10238 [Tieghemostelium lacteum]|uniref:Uncharacterized protein n=1 Tax=Tieghemostelium lacteum TaxID=361077 RepID=A0A151Z526_TIELA|nr:hypothetical protein DLAC_10238 [Tieghemostelium lacteum]|eukprot:KYQ89017.1 hypothetical protein DLAC_10238 [Tieghemostelium lacteum]